MKHKQLLVILIAILLTAFVVNGVNHHRENRNGRNNHRIENSKPEMKHGRMQNEVKCDKGTTAYVEVGKPLKPYEVANLWVNQTL